jgi:hypothetical protein
MIKETHETWVIIGLPYIHHTKRGHFPLINHKKRGHASSKGGFQILVKKEDSMWA